MQPMSCKICAKNKTKTSDEKSCTSCRHYLGGGQCRINLERECAYGEYEAWEPAYAQTAKKHIFVDLREMIS